MNVLQIDHLGKEYQGSPALADVNFAVGDHEFVSIVGPSGCGKTTLMKCVAGLVSPSAGTVRVMDKVVHGVPDGLAVVFQDYSRSLYPWMRVATNIDFPLRALGLSASQRHARVREALDAVRLGDKAKKYPWELSGGMQQRIAIARALAYRPKVLLMDEPFASVDAQTRADLEDLARAVHRDFRMTTLFVTHDIDESVYVADRVVVLRRSPGRVLTELDVDLPDERDQIGTKSLPRFIELRRTVARSIRDASSNSLPDPLTTP
jgi:NitT/TauT family transport system ATP-binding protein